MSDAFLEARDLRKRYGDLAAVDGVSLRVGPGELFGLLGPNGAGKTTLLSILTGLLAADAGTVTLDGQPLTVDGMSLRHRVGLGTQDLALYPDLTARENLTFFGRLYDLPRERLRIRVDELLQAVGLSDRADDRAGTFSGGMKRRLNLAVAVVHSPDVLYLDEPTTGVDPQSRNHIFELVKTLNAGGMTVIYTSHYLEEVQSLCKRLAILDRGRVKACSTVNDLLAMLNATLELTGVPMIDAFRHMPGVKAVDAKGDGVIITATAIAPLLPVIAELCRTKGVTPTGMHVSEPTLEKVFLHLTGEGLRD